ncbi:MAG: UDP-N-acetylmuramoyl-tripeptide--D-alanyl-D-alanine ligase [Actinobacteria bacterium]|uniref:UDP-MurNAc-pentapeptide synthetase n=1 Tax=freshwater metagenome TaxID=449393 RepID=A0A6J6FJQ0_9ZZZZ|nr:UDP-N-acetylmuramoyl-tripeptide--D-alanyl-D-alanine ligase [Actinomycetota bacterium]
MINLRASEIAKIVRGELVGDDVAVTSAPVFDSKAAKPGSIFLALKGEKVDGHSYIESAFANGAVLAFVTVASANRCIVVPDVMSALNLLAAHVREVLKDLTVIALTGSQGKTTTKDLLQHILESVGKTVAPVGNFNNELGTPITLLQCDENTKFCILEMGARHVGDIATLCKMAKPNIGMVLRVGTAHIGEFGSAEAVATAKSEMISSLEGSAIAILGQYDDFTKEMSSLHNGKLLTFGETTSADVRATDIEIREGRPHFDLVTPAGRAAVGLRIVGIHQVANALAAAAVASALGASIDLIAGALSTAEVNSKWRMQIHEFNGFVLINDAYNSSPESAEAALRTLVLFAQERGGQSWAFLGKMHELGASSRERHAAIGTLALELGIDHLVGISSPEYAEAVGANSAMTVHLFESKEDSLSLVDQMRSGDVILVKASRAEAFEFLAEEISSKLEAIAVDSEEEER